MDPIVNFFKSRIQNLPVSWDATIIELSTGDGMKLPNPSVEGEYNLVIAADNEAPEIVRVTSKSGDLLTISRAQEGTIATSKTSGKVWNVLMSLTAKVVVDIQTELEMLSSRIEDSEENIDGLLSVTSSLLTGFSDLQVKVNDIESIVDDLPSNILTSELLSARIFIGNASNVATGVTLSGDATISSAGVLALGGKVVTNAKFRDSAALSVVGRGSNSSGSVADISAASDHQILRRSGTAVGFGAINLESTNAVSGILGLSNGGTGFSEYAQGQLLIGKSNGGLAKANLSAGSGISITNGDGSIIISSSGGGSVTQVGAGVGMSFENITESGYVALGTPSTLSLETSNNVSGSTHTHALDLSGRVITAGDGLAGGGNLGSNLSFAVDGSVQRSAGNAQYIGTSGIIISFGGSRTLSAADNGKILYCTSSSAVNITTASGLGAGFSCTIIQGGTGQITVAQGASTTRVSFGSLFKTSGRYAMVTIMCPVANTFVVGGQLTI